MNDVVLEDETELMESTELINLESDDRTILRQINDSAINSPRIMCSSGRRNCMKERSLNQRVVKARYAVRCEIVHRAQELQKLLHRTDHGLPFTEVIACNIGNPHAIGQQPLTYIRQILSACLYPSLLDHPNLFPSDIIDRAKWYLNQIPGGIGAYSESEGALVVRKEISEFIHRRDGIKVSPSSLMICKGASEAVKHTLQTLLRDADDGVLIPIPQYPLYSSTITVNGGSAVGYYLDEETNWSQEEEELERAFAEATTNGIHLRAMVVINPGNPTGQCLSIEAMQIVVKFCLRHDLLLLADEVYQENVYVDSFEFTSFHKLIHSMGDPYQDLNLISYHSASKGYTGECGLRGGYMHLHRITSDMQKQFLKLASTSLCSNVIGQIGLGLSVNPPKSSDASYSLFIKERELILSRLRNRAHRLVEGLNRIPGITCTKVQGAMYAFPKVALSDKAIEAGQCAEMAPDAYFCLRLLESTGIVTVPGSGFHQRVGTWHFRLTILPDDDKIDKMLMLLQSFMQRFHEEYGIMD
jgi:alanine transaminase